MGGKMMNWAIQLTDAQAKAVSTLTNRITAVIICLLLVAGFVWYIKMLFTERDNARRLESDERIRMAAARSERELNAWRGVDQDKVDQIAKLKKRISDLEKQNARMDYIIKNAKVKSDVANRTEED